MDRRDDAPGKDLNMINGGVNIQEPQAGAWLGAVQIVEAAGGPNRRIWLEDRMQEAGQSGARTFSVCCDFDSAGPWAGVSGLFTSLYAEIQAQRPDLIERHAYELVHILPQLRRSLTVRNPNLTDLAPAHERTRNYPVDRAFRIVHGLIDLLDTWKTAVCPDSPWLIACDAYDSAGRMSTFFFKELMRRRGARLHIGLLVAVDPGKGAAAKTSFHVIQPAEVITVELAPSPADAIDCDQAARMASELEARVGEDRLETLLALSDMIRLWRLAGRADKVLHYRFLGLETYNTLGLYEDALRYGNGLLPLAAEHAPADESLRWMIILKLLMCHIGLGDVQASLSVAEREGLKAAENDPQRAVTLLYLIAMFYGRFQKPRDFAKGEEYLERALAALEQARSRLSEGDFHFQYVFNRNGLAMIRNFQGRHQDALELCRSGIERLNAHLGAEQHRLHRSILFYNMAQVYAATGGYDEAIKCFSVTLSMDPNYSEYYNERGSIFLQMGRLEEARADYLKAVELSPPYFEVFTNLGQCYRQMGAMAEAIESYSRALDLEPDHVLALLGRAKAHEESGRAQKAIADYTAALIRDPRQWEAVASRGVLHYEAGDFTAALADFSAAILLKPGNSDLHQNRATVLADLGRYHDAARDLQTSLDLDPAEEDRPVLQAKLEAALRAAAACQPRACELETAAG
jgi:tetratricopeptide (TPR) repeat protein